MRPPPEVEISPQQAGEIEAEVVGAYLHIFISGLDEFSRVAGTGIPPRRSSGTAWIVRV